MHEEQVLKWDDPTQTWKGDFTSPVQHNKAGSKELLHVLQWAYKQVNEIFSVDVSRAFKWADAHLNTAAVCGYKPEVVADTVNKKMRFVFLDDYGVVKIEAVVSITEVPTLSRAVWKIVIDWVSNGKFHKTIYFDHAMQQACDDIQLLFHELYARAGAQKPITPLDAMFLTDGPGARHVYAFHPSIHAARLYAAWPLWTNVGPLYTLTSTEISQLLTCWFYKTAGRGFASHLNDGRFFLTPSEMFWGSKAPTMTHLSDVLATAGSMFKVPVKAKTSVPAVKSVVKETIAAKDLMSSMMTISEAVAKFPPTAMQLIAKAKLPLPDKLMDNLEKELKSGAASVKLHPKLTVQYMPMQDAYEFAYGDKAMMVTQDTMEDAKGINYVLALVAKELGVPDEELAKFNPGAEDHTHAFNIMAGKKTTLKDMASAIDETTLTPDQNTAFIKAILSQPELLVGKPKQIQMEVPKAKSVGANPTLSQFTKKAAKHKLAYSGLLNDPKEEQALQAIREIQYHLQGPAQGILRGIQLMIEAKKNEPKRVRFTLGGHKIHQTEWLSLKGKDTHPDSKVA